MTPDLFFEKWGPSDRKDWDAFERDMQDLGARVRIVPLGDPEDEETNCLVWQGGLLLASSLIYGLLKSAARDVDMEAFRLLSRVQLRLFALIDREQDIFDALANGASNQ